MLLDLVNATVKFIQTVGDAKYTNDITMEMLAEQVRLQTFMNDWKTNFECIQENDPSASNDQIKVGCHLLQAIYTTMDIWLSAALYPNETAWDMFKEQFEDIVRLSGILVASSVRFPDELSKRFSFEMGIIPPLHFVAWKCRWPHIRRKALALLWASPRRECLFESHRSFMCFQRVMEVEEEGLGLGPGQMPGPDQLPPEEARIHQVDIAAAEPTPEGYPISFLMKPDGIDGAWCSRVEVVNLGKVEFDEGLTEWMAKEATPPKHSADDILNPAIRCTEVIHDPNSMQSYTGLPVNGSGNIASVGRWRPQDTLEAERHTRKTLFAAASHHTPQSGLGTPEHLGTDHLSDAESSYFQTHSALGTPGSFGDQTFFGDFSISAASPSNATFLVYHHADDSN
jgi:hypothetical protein